MSCYLIGGRRMTWAVFPGDDHTRAVVEVLNANLLPQGSERIIAIVGGALLEEAVERTLRERLVDNTAAANLLKPDGPLGNTGPQIDLLCLLGAFDDKVRRAMGALCRVRNFFAH